MKHFLRYALMMIFTLFGIAHAQEEPVDHQTIARIKIEGFQKSQVMETLRYLTDVAGPRLTGSPNLKHAGEWARDSMAEWGLQNAKLEPWGEFGRGWTVERFSVEMLEPQYQNLLAYPKAWTPGTGGTVKGTPVFTDISTTADFEKYRGKLKGKIVMNRKPIEPDPHFTPDATRNTPEVLAERARAIESGEQSSYAERQNRRSRFRETARAMRYFFKDEGVAAYIEPSSRDHGVLRVGSHGPYQVDEEDTYPAFVMAKEHYGRILRLMDRNIQVKLELNLKTKFHDDDTKAYNVIAEIQGADPQLKDEIVMLGGHLDSWHSGTGATDNAAGCAAMMEAVRILQSIGVKPRRTIRIALWSGEEQGLLGSVNYVKNHFADLMTMQLKEEHEKFSGYFNMDNGTGKIRGIYLQGNEAVRPIFEAYLKPFHYLDATTVTTNNTGGTDHLSFHSVGLPGFQFIQDPIEYRTRTHHTNVDVSEYVVENDLKQAAVIIATFVYHTAMRDNKLPRMQLPIVPPAQ